MGSLAVDEADNEIVDPNNVKETTDILKNEQKKTLKKIKGKTMHQI